METSSLLTPHLKDLAARYEHNLVVPGEELPDLSGERVLALDVETCPRSEHLRDKREPALNPWKNLVVGFSVAVPGHSWYVPIRHAGLGAPNIDVDSARAWLQGTLRERSDRLIINQTIRFDLHTLREDLGVEVPMDAELWDTQVAAMLIDENAENHRLKPMAERYLNLPATEEALLETFFKERRGDKGNYATVPVDLMAPYGCGDVERALKLATWQQGQLEREGVLPVWNLERRVTWSLYSMEKAGVRVDEELLQRRLTEHLERQVAVEKQISDLIGVSFNPSSGEELTDVVVNRLGLPILEKSWKTGEPSFDDAVLLKYIERYPDWARLFWCVRQARRLDHTRSSFIEPYLEWAVREGTDLVIHAKFNQSDARSGRMSGSNPNLQQVAKEETWELKVRDQVVETWTAPGAREFFIPRREHVWLVQDLSQIEYRLFAHYANSPRMLAAYRDNPDMDYHAWCAEVILENLLPRDKAKNLNFGFIYGMGKDKLYASMSSEAQPISAEKAAEIVAKYHREVPELRPLQENVAAALRARGYVRTILGRKRRIDPRWNERKKGEKPRGLLPYQAFNALCQGGGADVLKYVIAKMGRNPGGYLLNAPTGCELVLPVHDEVITELPAQGWERYALELRRFMQEFPACRVPIYAEATLVTERWSKKVKLGRTSAVPAPEVGAKSAETA